MELTGKCKANFENWYCYWVRNLRNDYHKYTNQILLNKYYREVDSMKYGVYVDFFDSVGLKLKMNISSSGCFLSGEVVKTDEYLRFYTEVCGHRNECRIKLINKANEIYNK